MVPRAGIIGDNTRTTFMRLPACAAAAALLLSHASAQPTAAPTVALTIDQCVAGALAKNFTVQISTFQKDSAEAGVIIAQSVYDPVLGVQWQKTVTRSSDQSIDFAFINDQPVELVGVYPYDNSTTTTLSAKENLITGGTVDAQYVLTRDQSSPERYFLNPAYVGDVSLNVTQPLLQGAGTDYARAAIEIQRINGRIAGLNLKNSVLSMVFNVETAYFNVIGAQRQYEVGQAALQQSQQLLDDNSYKRKTGVLTDLDVVQAQAGVATSRSQLIGFRQAMENNEDLLLQAMGEREFKTRVGHIDLPGEPETPVSFDSSYKIARDNGPNLAIVQATIEQYQLQALRAKRDALPSLNANGAGGYSAERANYGSAFTHVFAGPGYNWQAGVTLSFPWGLRQSRAALRQVMDNLHGEQATLDQTDQTLVVNLRSAIRAIFANRESVAAAQEAATLSEKQYELQKAKFDSGLATSYDVLQAQNQLESSRLGLIQAQVSLRIASADLRFLEGLSLDHYHIDLKS